jgi:hypothetical protein
MTRVCKSCGLGRVSGTEGKNLAACAVCKGDASGMQDEMCAFTQTRIENCWNVEYSARELRELYMIAIYREESKSLHGSGSVEVGFFGVFAREEYC